MTDAFRRYGARTGRLVIYFHGAPGDATEGAWFDDVATRAGVDLWCLDRSDIALNLAGESYFLTLARRIDDLAAGAPYTLVGFSLGGFVALRTAPYLSDQMTRLHLVSAAAPLEGGDFLKAMAGKPVFELARRSKILFGLATCVQGVLATKAPALFFRTLFATAQGDDRTLAQNAGFQTQVAAILRRSLALNARAYQRDVTHYVRPWHDLLAEVSLPTVIWHGSHDNWSPTSMAACLAAAVEATERVEILEGLSHYSTLFAAMPRCLYEVRTGLEIETDP